MYDFLLNQYIASLGFCPSSVVRLPGPCVGFRSGRIDYVLVLEADASGEINLELYNINYSDYNLDCKSDYDFFLRGEYRNLPHLVINGKT